jgi:hypothetical protein
MHTQTSASTGNAAVNPKRRYLCRHVFTDGHRCGSPALRAEPLCYYHTRSRREAPCASRTGTFVMQRIDDRASIQLALFDVLSRLASGDIEYKRGSMLLYGLQIASSNLGRHNHPIAQQPPQVEEITSDYELGDLAPVAEYLESTAELADPAQLPIQEEATIAPPAPGEPAVTPAAPIPLNPSLPTRDAAGRLYPPPHKLDPPDTGKVPWPRGARCRPLPSATLKPNDSHPRMAP